MSIKQQQENELKELRATISKIEDKWLQGSTNSDGDYVLPEAYYDYINMLLEV